MREAQKPQLKILIQLNMDVQTIKERFAVIQSKREYLLSLLERPNLGILRVDVNQALEEMDELVDEFRRTFPLETN